ACAELDGSAARGDTSYLLLCTLAAAPALDGDGRRSACERIAGAWAKGAIALPPRPVRLAADSRGEPWRLLFDPRYEAIRDRPRAHAARRGRPRVHAPPSRPRVDRAQRRTPHGLRARGAPLDGRLRRRGRSRHVPRAAPRAPPLRPAQLLRRQRQPRAAHAA